MIYIIEFSGELGSEKHKAKYYIGWCKAGEVNRRLAEHRRGEGSKITKAAVERGFTLTVVCTMPGDRKLERKLKNQHNTRRIVENLLKGNAK